MVGQYEKAKHRTNFGPEETEAMTYRTRQKVAEERMAMKKSLIQQITVSVCV